MLTWLALSACTTSTPTDTGSPPSEPGFYDDPAGWICHPDLDDDVCRGDFALSEVAPDGSVQVVEHEVASAPAVDCFYVYPTVSTDPEPNSDRVDGGEESLTTELQAGRYSEHCRLYAPLYRQVTNAGLFDPGADFGLAYADVEEAFDAYLAHSDRPFLLLGHSQGTGHLSTLVARRIEEEPALAERLVAAHLIGGFVEVPVGADVGATFAATPLCRAPDETGCVVHYVSFAADDAPGEAAFFGRTLTPGNRIACNNPAALAGGSVVLSGAYPTELPGGFVGETSGPYADPDDDQLTTPYYDLPGFVSGECVEADGARFLAIATDPDPTDPRTDELGGEFILPGWGLHLVDVNLAQRDLVALAGEQIAAFRGD